MTASVPESTPAIELRVLDDVAVVVGGETRPVSRPREQAVLARLALSSPHQVPIEALVEDIWGEAAAPGAVDSLRVHVSNLRKLLAGGQRPASEVLVTTSGAYRVELPADAVDALALEEACRRGDVEGIRRLLGPWPAQDLRRFDTGTGFFAASAQRLDDLRVHGTLAVARDHLAEGRPEPAATGLEDVLRHRPHHEEAWVLLVRARHAQGRRTEALRTGNRARDALAEVGMEPGPDLVAAEQAVLRAGPPATDTVARPSGDYADVDGSRVAYATIGGAPDDLLFLHGGFVPFSVMPDEPRLARFLDDLAATFRVILVDRRGIGMSDPPADGPVGIDHWVQDCRAVLDAVGSTRALVLAHENGGPVALRLAAAHPDRIRGLVLHSTAARPLRSPDHPYGPTREVYEWVGRMLDRRLGDDEVLRSVAPSVGDDAALASWLDRAGRLGAGPTRAAELHRAYLDCDVREVLADVRAPSIVLQPARRIRSDPGQARFLADQLADAELQLLDSADHLPWLADAETVLGAVRRLHDRTKGTGEGPPAVLRALVAVCPASGADVLVDHGAESCLELTDAVVAAFTSRSRAEAARARVADRHPGARTCLEVADTRATPDDPAVREIVDRVRAG